MKEIQLVKGGVRENFSRDIYVQKSNIEHTPLGHTIMKIIVIASYEFIVGTMKYDYKDYEKISNWLNEETEKIFEEYKKDPSEFSGNMIIRQFTTQTIADIDAIVEEFDNQ